MFEHLNRGPTLGANPKFVDLIDQSSVGITLSI